jgi:uncharacterized protein (TIGR02145 family)
MLWYFIILLEKYEIMKRLVFFVIIFCAVKSNAQNYLISFTGSGASATVNSVRVENLTKSTSITLNGSDNLRLTVTTDVNSVNGTQLSELKIYPNPMTDNSTIEVCPPVNGDAIISVLDFNGKQIAQLQTYLENSLQTFRLSGIKSGFYLVNIKGNNYNFSSKLLSSGESFGTAKIEKLRSTGQTVDEKVSKAAKKGVSTTIDMAYTTGDRLKLTATSGNYSTVRIDIPASDKTINFVFVACTDADNYNYPVVEIGNQKWMAENLKTSKYRNGELIGSTVPATLDITGESSPKYQWAYNGNESNVASYGRLYTWYAVADSRNVCPTGWHLPTDNEWTTLADYLSNNGYGYQGTGTDIAKSLVTASGWLTFATPGAPGNDQKSNNASGFSALPGGYRPNNISSFTNFGQRGQWWTSTEVSSANAYYVYLTYHVNELGRTNITKKDGFSIRCLKDIIDL